MEKVKCPLCNQRLFDLKSSEVDLEIKCPRCKKVVNIKRHLNNK